MHVCQTARAAKRSKQMGGGTFAVRIKIKNIALARLSSAFPPNTAPMLDFALLEPVSCHRRIPNLQRIKQPHQRPQLLIPLASLPHVMHKARRVGEVSRFAVAIIDARKNTENSEVALQIGRASLGKECA